MIFKRPTLQLDSRPLFCARLQTKRHRMDSFFHWISILTIASLVFTKSQGLAERDAQVNFSPIEVKLVSDQLSIQPGQPFTIGIYQSIRPGYHTYWKNAGTVGLPSAVEWKLPQGFVASQIFWPTPEISKMADYSVWGYHNEALLLTVITPPKEFPTGVPIEIVGETSWMCCGKQCHPGYKTLTLNLTTTAVSNPNSDWVIPFQKTRNAQPRAFEAWSVKASRIEDHYALQLTTDAPIPASQSNQLRFFGYHRQVSSAKPQRTERIENGYILHLEHEEFSGEDRKTLSGIVTSATDWNPDFPTSPLLIDTPLTFQITPRGQ